MTLTVEDGTGKTDADSYVSLTDAATHHTSFGNSAWASAASDTVREVALRKATRYLDSHYRFAGLRTVTDQALQWPRTGVQVNGRLQASDEIPAAIVQATCEMALLALTEDLSPVLARGGQVLSEQVGPLAVTYADGAPGRPVYGLVDDLMRPVAISANVVTVLRA